MAKKQVVILGGGFGGLQAALRLSRGIKKHGLQNAVSVTLADKNPYHTFTPLLYEIATTSDAIAGHRQLKNLITFPLRTLLPSSVELVTDMVEKIDTCAHTILLSSRSLHFDYLILALGTETAFPPIPGLKEYALPIKTFDDAMHIRDAVLSEIENKNPNLQIVILGGGPTAVELAGELRSWLGELSKQKSSNIQSSVTLVEQAPLILASFPERMRALALRRLARFDITLKISETATAVRPGILELKSGATFPWSILIWAGGNRPTTVTTAATTLPKNERGQIRINSDVSVMNDMETSMLNHIFAVGDAATFINLHTGSVVPQVARPAIVQGKIAADAILADLRRAEGKLATNPQFQPFDYPYILPVAGKYAIAKFGPVIFDGFLAWIAKGLVELNYFLSILPFRKALAVWLEGLVIFIRNDRLG